MFGRGIGIEQEPDTEAPTSALVRASVIEHNHNVGLFVSGSYAVLEALVVRDTLPLPSDQLGGRGVVIQDSPFFGYRSNVELRASLIERNHDLGVHIGGSDALLEAVVVRGTLPQPFDQLHGRGIQLSETPVTNDPATAVLRASLIEQNYEFGVGVVGSEAQLVGVSIVDALPSQADGAFGDGVLVYSLTADAMAELSSCHIGPSARAGLSAFGSEVSIRATNLSCNGFHLANERCCENSGPIGVITDAGDNRCSCGEDEESCSAVSVGLEPPDPIE
jgi:hypothetical protein